MKLILKRDYLKIDNSKFVHWSKLIAITGGTQLFVQVTGFISGILIIRLLPTQEYAFYTLANTMFGTMVMLADSGISNGVMAQGGKVWQDKNKLGTVLSTGLNLRKRFGFISLIVTLPVLVYLLISHGASWIVTVLIVSSIIPAFFAALSDSLLEISPKLHQDIYSLQRNQAEVSFGRLALSTLFLFIFPFTFIALIASSIPRIYGNVQLKRISSKFVNNDEKTDPLVEKEIIKGVKRTLPIVIYHCISGQISIWLISFFGTTANISQLGALGRISILFNLFAALFSTLVVPRFARMPAIKKVLIKPFLLIQLATWSIGAILLVLLWLFSDNILWVLGKNYSSLNYELLLMGLSACIGLVAGVCDQLVISRGWFLRPYFLIGVNFTSTVISLAFFNISSIIGVLYFNIIVTAIAYLLVLFYGIFSINKAV
jgi:hypothetical protein